MHKKSGWSKDIRENGVQRQRKPISGIPGSNIHKTYGFKPIMINNKKIFPGYSQEKRAFQGVKINKSDYNVSRFAKIYSRTSSFTNKGSQKNSLILLFCIRCARFFLLCR